jgi:predicted acyl esterase
VGYRQRVPARTPRQARSLQQQFPKFDRNSNTGGDITTHTADQYQAAVSRILHDQDHPSRLILPIIER